MQGVSLFWEGANPNQSPFPDAGQAVGPSRVVLVDTSVWIDHLRKEDPVLQDLLEAGQVVIHPFIVGELACGNLKNRKEILEFLQNLPRAPSSTEEDVLFFIEHRGISGKGIGYLDAHRLSSVSLSEMDRSGLETGGSIRSPFP